MRRDSDGADARAAAAMGDAKSFVEVEGTDVGAEIAGATKADLGVHVGAIHVDLSAVGMNDVADLADCGFENPMGGRVGNHQGGEIVFVRVRFDPEIGQIDVAVFQASHGDNFES